MSRIDVKTLSEKLAKGENVCLVDVRSEGEYRSVCVDGARNIPLDTLEHHIEDLQKEHDVYVMCHSGNRSRAACQALREKGLTRVIDVEGGIQSWMQSALPVKSTGKRVMPLMQQVLLVAGLLILTGVLGALFVSPPFIYLAGFVGAGLTFAGVSGKCYMTQLLAWMPWNR